MRFDVTLIPDQLNRIPDAAREIENLGAAGLWTSETAHDPFLALSLAAHSTRCLQLGTATAIAFARSPMVIAQTAWDLAAQSGGRFILGLGSQVKAHITLRYGLPWAAPVPRLREYIKAVRAIWRSFQNGAPLRFRGEHYRLGLLTQFFNPGPIEYPDIPIFITAVNPGMLRLAGELCQGCHVHPFHTASTLRDVIRPNIAAGAAQAGRSLDDVQLNCTVFAVTGRDAEATRASADRARTQIAFYASTPAYRSVLDHHGWGDLQPRLSELARANQWADMKALISDDMLGAFALVAEPDDLPYAALERYAGLLDRIGYYLPFPSEDSATDHLWRHSARILSETTTPSKGTL
ncbi:MAG: TIGR03617 family F420-dependent LLM class oxidoreductase [Anaerolineae bacterium]|nr:TIGR03617 family F420-dependent LLM class oxidoreductase [Anaerolineae bacterium]